MKELQDFQHLFVTDLEVLSKENQGNIMYEEQNHYGDFLIEEVENGWERFKLWRNHDSNGGGILIEHAGAINEYRWETVFEEN